MRKPEYHVASYVVHLAERGRPRDALSSLPGVEIHAEENSKLIVTAEAADVRELAELCVAMQDIEGIVSVAPVYHEFTDGADAAPASDQTQAVNGEPAL